MSSLWSRGAQLWSRPGEGNQWPQGLAVRVTKLGKNLHYRNEDSEVQKPPRCEDGALGCAVRLLYGVPLNMSRPMGWTDADPAKALRRHMGKAESRPLLISGQFLGRKGRIWGHRGAAIARFSFANAAACFSRPRSLGCCPGGCGAMGSHHGAGQKRRGCRQWL